MPAVAGNWHLAAEKRRVRSQVRALGPLAAFGRQCRIPTQLSLKLESHKP